MKIENKLVITLTEEEEKVIEKTGDILSNHNWESKADIIDLINDNFEEEYQYQDLKYSAYDIVTDFLDYLLWLRRGPKN